MRGQDIGVVFQDPSTTLNPLLPVGRQIVEGEIAHGRLTPDKGKIRAVDLLREVEVRSPPAIALSNTRLQFSGGMRQRAGDRDGDGGTPPRSSSPTSPRPHST